MSNEEKPCTVKREHARWYRGMQRRTRPVTVIPRDKRLFDALIAIRFRRTKKAGH